jgi:hypothetical protein
LNDLDIKDINKFSSELTNICHITHVLTQWFYIFWKLCLFEVKLLILEAVQAGAIVKVGTGYKLDYQDKQSIIANNKNSLVEWFKNKENNPQVITIKSRIKKFLGEIEEND